MRAAGSSKRGALASVTDRSELLKVDKASAGKETASN